MNPFESESVLLRAFEPDDAEALHGYLNDPALQGRRYLPWGFPPCAPLSSQQVRAILEKWRHTDHGLALAIVERSSGLLVGHGECDWQWDAQFPSVSVVIAPVSQQRGYGGQALALLLAYLYGYTPAHNVTGWVDDWNSAGRDFCQAHGMQACGRMRRAGLRAGRFYDVVTYELLRPEWLALQGGRYAS